MKMTPHNLTTFVVGKDNFFFTFESTINDPLGSSVAVIISWMDVRVIPLVLNKYKDVSIIFSLTLSTLVMLCNPPNENDPNILGNVYPLFS